MRTLCEISKDGKTATFLVSGGRRLTTEIPDYPRDTHHVTIGRAGQLLVKPLDGKKPDNPIGPAVVTVHGEEIREVWMEDGRRVEPRAALDRGGTEALRRHKTSNRP